MKSIKNNIYLALLFLLLFSVAARAQYDPKKICKVEDGNLVFQLDQHWSDSQKSEISRLFDLDSLLLIKVFEGLPIVFVDSITWNVKVIKPGLVEISKMIEPYVKKNNRVDFRMIDNSWINLPVPGIEETAVYGKNSFTLVNAFSYNDGNACFFLPGYPDARSVYISGSMNNWSTMQSPMQRTDTGWLFCSKLLPGRYSYKYIIDGKWTPDPGNKLKENDTYGSHNSIVFCYNHVFKLKGYTDAKTVVVCGSFNNWNEKELKMTRTPEGWELPVFLREGTHAYKFKVDKQWFTDPANPVIRPDGRGNENSFMAIGDTLVFRLNGFTTAKNVMLAGSFNGWNPGELAMQKDSLGWYLSYVLAKGNYEYKFIADGKWMIDPSNPYSTGGGDMENSFLTFQPNHIFELDTFPNARQVIITGSFNSWSTENYRMKKKDGKWIFPIRLNAGKHTYKFIVDGTWMLDPANELWEENEYGTHNSVLWMGP